MLRPALPFVALLAALAGCQPATPEYEPLPSGQQAPSTAEVRDAIRAGSQGPVPRPRDCVGTDCAGQQGRQQVELAEAFAGALEASDDAPALQAAQRRWAARKLACRETAEPARCVEEARRSRVAELHQIAASAPRLVEYTCEGSDLPFTARFRDGDRPSAVFMLGGDRVEVPLARSGSGARYAGEGVEYWEHQGKANVEFLGTRLTCTPLG